MLVFTEHFLHAKDNVLSILENLGSIAALVFKGGNQGVQWLSNLPKGS